MVLMVSTGAAAVSHCAVILREDGHVHTFQCMLLSFWHFLAVTTGNC